MDTNCTNDRSWQFKKNTTVNRPGYEWAHGSRTGGSVGRAKTGLTVSQGKMPACEGSSIGIPRWEAFIGSVRTRVVSGVIAVALSAGAMAQQSAPREARYPLGVDSTGVPWSVVVALNKPLTVFGSRNLQVKTREPLDLELYGVIDSHNAAWIVDQKGRGVRVKLSDGTATEFRVPVSRTLRGLAVSDDKLYFTDTVGADGLSVQQMDFVSGRRQTIAKLDAKWSLHGLISGKHHLWIALSTGLMPGRHTIELVAVDWATGKVVLRSRREMPLAQTPWTTFEVVESEDGGAWVANGSTSRIERLAISGAWQGWSLGGRTPSNLVAARFGAACLLRRQQAPKDEGYDLPGVPAPGLRVLSREIVAIQEGSRELLTTTIDADATLSADGAGGVRVDGQRRLSLAGGRLQIVPEQSR